MSGDTVKLSCESWMPTFWSPSPKECVVTLESLMTMLTSFLSSVLDAAHVVTPEVCATAGYYEWVSELAGQ